MKVKLSIDGKEFEVEINNPELEKLIKPRKTGYERAEEDRTYYRINHCDNIENYLDSRQFTATNCYENANYYTDKTVAENNARADKLMRQLRRFAVENRFEKLRWSDTTQWKHYIVWDCGGLPGIHHCTTTREPGVVYFDSVEAAADAIETFHDELIWYFTEYKDSL